MKNKNTPGRVDRPMTYMLRRALCPWKRDEIIAETVAFCRENRVDEIMWKTESTGMYRELLPRPEIRKIAADLVVARARTEAAGLVYSINPLTTIGHGDYGGEGALVHPDIEWMVDYRGARARFCACPLSPAWRELMRETFALYAATRPARLWLEDDFRYFNHGPAVSLGCYCERHLAEFNRRVNRRLTRETLVRAVLRPGEPDPLRLAWLAFLEWTLADAAAMIRAAVHAVCPETQLAWMSVAPAVHEVEGREPAVQVRACAGPGRAAIRMTTTTFNELTPRDMLIADEALKKVGPRLPAGTLKCIEVENFPHSLFNKSCARVAAQVAWGCVTGAPHATLNIYDYIGSPLALEPWYGAMLRAQKPFFAALAECFAGAPAHRGVAIPCHPRAAYLTRTGAGTDKEELMPREGGWADPLRAFGLAVTWSRPEAVSALTGQAPRLLAADELRALLGRGVLLDFSALRTLAEMGLGRYAGVEPAGVIPWRSRPIGSEELTDPAFAGGPAHYTWAIGMDIGVLAPRPGARVVSRVLDPEGALLAPGVTVFENELGGRTAVFPYELCGRGIDSYAKGPANAFYSQYRRGQVRALVDWLGRGAPPLAVEAPGWALAHRGDGPGRTALAVMNLNYDAWPGLELACTLAKRPQRAAWLDAGGRWRSLAPGAWDYRRGVLRVRLARPVATHETVAVRADLAG